MKGFPSCIQMGVESMEDAVSGPRLLDLRGEVQDRRIEFPVSVWAIRLRSVALNCYLNFIYFVCGLTLTLHAVPYSDFVKCF